MNNEASKLCDHLQWALETRVRAEAHPVFLLDADVQEKVDKYAEQIAENLVQLLDRNIPL